MRTSLDSYLGVHPQALSLEARRNELLAANLANVDTPNYKARDIDFKAAMAAAGGNGSATPGASLPLTPANALSQPRAGASTIDNGGGALDPTLLKYRVPMAPSLDGNTVDEQLEQSAFAENTVRYQATLTFLTSKLRDLMTAITGS